MPVLSGVYWPRNCLYQVGGEQALAGLIVSRMPSPTTEPPPMPTFSSTLPTCAACGAVFTPFEYEANLWLLSLLIATTWQYPIRMLHLRCVAHGPQDAAEDL
jgi:hypothetical protein